jgi:hypothetical protein
VNGSSADESVKESRKIVEPDTLEVIESDQEKASKPKGSTNPRGDHVDVGKLSMK